MFSRFLRFSDPKYRKYRCFFCTPETQGYGIYVFLTFGSKIHGIYAACSCFCPYFCFCFCSCFCFCFLLVFVFLLLLHHHLLLAFLTLVLLVILALFVPFLFLLLFISSLTRFPCSSPGPADIHYIYIIYGDRSKRSL